MKNAVYTVELIDELSGAYMDFEFYYELERGQTPPDEISQEITEAILSNISVVARFDRIED